jgi:predicted MFS family arabinose efflux permease
MMYHNYHNHHNHHNHDDDNSDNSDNDPDNHYTGIIDLTQCNVIVQDVRRALCNLTNNDNATVEKIFTAFDASIYGSYAYIAAYTIATSDFTHLWRLCFGIACRLPCMLVHRSTAVDRDRKARMFFSDRMYVITAAMCMLTTSYHDDMLIFVASPRNWGAAMLMAMHIMFLSVVRGEYFMSLYVAVLTYGLAECIFPTPVVD